MDLTGSIIFAIWAHCVLYRWLMDVLASCKSADAVNEQNCVSYVLVDCDWPRAGIGVQRLALALGHATGADCSPALYASGNSIGTPC